MVGRREVGGSTQERPLLARHQHVQMDFRAQSSCVSGQAQGLLGQGLVFNQEAQSRDLHVISKGR